MNIFDVLVASKIGGGGGGGSYNNLSNKPKINGTSLQGNKSASALGLAGTSDIENLQSQIDAITSATDVRDVVDTYADLEDYDTSVLFDEDIVKVLEDETHSDAISYYRWTIEESSGSWSYIGSQGPFYTKAEIDLIIEEKIQESTSDMITDVQINGESIVENEVANIPMASTQNLGAVKIAPENGIAITNSGNLTTNIATVEDIAAKTNTKKPIVPSTIQYAVDLCMPSQTFITTQSVAPSSSISDGGIHIVILDAEPTQKYDGYIYMIKEA